MQNYFKYFSAKISQESIGSSLPVLATIYEVKDHAKRILKTNLDFYGFYGTLKVEFWKFYNHEHLGFLW